MAIKIFRIHENGNTANSGWFNSGAITSKELENIITDNKGVATSIPSPFARIDLVKAAFKWVANNGIDGDSAKHKLVSDALDVGQLFFLSNLNKEIEIIEYNPTARFKELQNTTHPELAKTLKTFWNQDSNIYNFNHTSKLFFVCNNKQVVGRTSPATIFFAAPDANAHALNMKIIRRKDKLLDKNYMSLAKREWSYIEYIFAISKTTQFRKNFTAKGHNEFDDYLTKVKESLSHEEKLKIQNINKNTINKYDKCHVTNSPNNYCDILGIPLGVQIQDRTKIEKESQFVIKSTLSEKKPLVLPYNKFTPKWKYTTKDVKWDGEKMNKKVTYKNNKKDSDSRLPVHNDKYPWLSIGNFLEDKIIKLPYSIDSSKFEMCGSKKYLLPLTKTFFKYFETSKVKQLFKFHQLAAGGWKLN